MTAPPFRTLQAVNSKTFNVPPAFLDSTVSLPELCDHHLEHSPDHPLFVYENAPDDVRTITWSQGARAIHRAGRFVLSHGKGLNLLPSANLAKPPVIGVLAVTDTCTSLAIVNGIMRAGYTVFLVSPRNSAVAVAHLLKATNCKLLLVSRDRLMQDLARDATSKLDSNVDLITTPRFEDLYKEDGAFEKLPAYPVDLDSPALISHSSGSTSFPKPITITHRALARLTLIPYYSDIDLCGKIVGAHSMVLFHIMGVMGLLEWTVGSGAIIAVFKPEDPPIISTPESVLAASLATKSSHVLCVPSFIESWSLDPDNLPLLKSLEAILYGGGPLQKHVGDTMAENGVTIRPIYGATEIGSLGVVTGEFAGKDWEYFELSLQLTVHFEPQGDIKGAYEPIVVASSTYVPNAINTTLNGKPAYATSDLLVPHPTKKSHWKVYGRADDQIMHSTGEKTNPGPLEAIIKKHPSVRSCLMFGRGQFQAGILIEPVESKSFDPTDMVKLAAFRNEIWDQIEEANQFAPKHSRIFKEMIVASDPSKPFQFTPKGTPRRQIMLEQYTSEIEATYKAVEDSARQDIPPLRSWEPNDCVEFVRNAVHKIVTRPIGDNDDLFQSGADSLQATSLRNSILRAFRESQKDTTSLGQNLVYTHPTIASLGQFISQVSTGEEQANATYESVTRDMEAMLKEFTQNFPSHSAFKPAPNDEVILVTGTTGSLGSHMLNKLISQPSVRRVYALNRPDRSGKQTVLQRQRYAFEEHGIDTSVLGSEKLVLLEGDTSSPDLGLSSSTFAEIFASLTTIIHNAWRVDFNLSLASFKPLVQGVRNLIDLALASPLPEPPRIIFTSSIGTLSSWKEPTAVPETALVDASVAVGNGYGESKWVSERILDIARQKTGLQTIVVRVGQLCGSVTNGNWNVWEWFPAIVQSSKLVGCLPDGKGLVTWVPIDTAAAAVIDMRASPSPFVHLVHPKPVPWSTVITPLAQSLGVLTVPYAEWLAKLEKALEDSSASAVEAAREQPALRLMDFYRNVQVGDDPAMEAFTRTRLDVKEAVKVSKTLGDANLLPLSSDDTDRWLGFWKQKGALKQ